MYQVKAPENKADFRRYTYFRWQMLRQPWNQPRGSEVDELEKRSIHRVIKNRSGDIIAVGRLHKTTQFDAQIRYMAVNVHEQGKGLGRLIINALEHEASKLGVKTITLNARQIALDFYLKLGYQKIKPAHVLYGEIQHYTMKKSIAKPKSHQLSAAIQLTSLWHQTIPMSKAMNVQVDYFDGKQLYTSCDIAFNKNLHNTMFAGSIYTLATLTGWGWVYMQLVFNKLKGDIVLADANIKYLAPITGPNTGFTQQTQTEGDFSLLETKGKARIHVAVDIKSGDSVAAKFSGHYVVLNVVPANET